ncbi:MAG: MBL fold metallo-hydrolase [Clostridia bacterium]|nr:MBL fold metallo-hydrolase [Clostridia bacterium]
MHKIYTFTPAGYFGANTYVIECGSEYAVVDPAVGYREVLKSLPECEGKIKYILLTHAHFDHILKIDEWVGASTEVYIGERDREALADPYRNCYLGFFGTNEGYFGKVLGVKNADEIPLGNSVIRVIECPGHTPGGVGYVIGSDLIIGDTLFAEGGYGRCDLPGGDMHALADTLGILFSFTEDYTLYPGHGAITTLKETKKYF